MLNAHYSSKIENLIFVSGYLYLMIARLTSLSILSIITLREGYIRTSSEDYSLNQDSLAAPWIHLTNNAI